MGIIGKFGIVVVAIILFLSPPNALGGFYPQDGGGGDVTISMQEQFKAIAPVVDFMLHVFKELKMNNNDSNDSVTASEDNEDYNASYEDTSDYSKSVSPRMEIKDEYVSGK